MRNRFNTCLSLQPAVSLNRFSPDLTVVGGAITLGFDPNSDGLRPLVMLLITIWPLINGGNLGITAHANGTDVDFTRDIRPILEKRCVSCHGALKQKGGLRLDAAKLVLRGGENGAVIVPGRSEESSLVTRLKSKNEDERMPPEGVPLESEQIQKIERWIKAGATAPPNETIIASPDQHWAFLPVKRPKIPGVENYDPLRETRNPIDAFVQSKLSTKGWTLREPRPDRWLRRVFLDVIGLPPTLAELARFKVPNSDRARLEVIEYLLGRPQYGERWGRHWLDVVRYAESNGYERDAAKPFAWRYRDYVVDSLNRDKPWDRFVQEQFAGDELPGSTSESAIATTFLRLGPWDDEPADPETDRFDQLDDLVSTTSLGFLGLNLGCARCHDHKFEPLSAADYYGLLAVFAPLERPRNGREELTVPAGPPSKVSEWIETQKLARSRGQTNKVSNPELPEAYLWHEPNLNPAPTRILIRGQPGRLGAEVKPAIPVVLEGKVPIHGNVKPSVRTTGRRLALAEWLTHRDNPLTARVLVNRVWQQHFGEGLVRSANNFGISGTPPTHPELLDWLASWFMNEGEWSLKRLHRLILSSRSYAMGKDLDTEKRAIDPENTMLWRQNYRRLEAETIRDSILMVSGRLNWKMGGPSVYPPVPKTILEGNSDLDKIWPTSSVEESSRRTVYTFIKRAMVHPLLEVLDLCDTTQVSAKRNTTTVPTQALTLFNSDFVNEQAKVFADRIRREAGGEPRTQVIHAYQVALSRQPTLEEQAVMAEFLKQHSLEQLCRAVLNLNEFVYPD